MSVARTRMTMRAVLQRNTGTGTDDHGQPSLPVWSAGTSTPCYCWSRSKREALDENRTALVEDWRAIMPANTDVTEQDRILNVTDRRGTEIFAGPLLIDAVQVKPTHLELSLRQVD